MQKDNKENKTKLGNLNDVIDVMFFGEKTPREARIKDALDRRAKKKKANPAK